MFHNSVLEKWSIKCDILVFVFLGCTSIHKDFIMKYPPGIPTGDTRVSHTDSSGSYGTKGKPTEDVGRR